MVSITNNIGQHLYSIDWEEGIINISSKGKEYFIQNSNKIKSEQPKNIPYSEEVITILKQINEQI